MGSARRHGMGRAASLGPPVSWTMNHSEDPCLPPSKGCSFQGVVPHGLSAGRQQDGKDLPRGCWPWPGARQGMAPQMSLSGKIWS